VNAELGSNISAAPNFEQAHEFTTKVERRLSIFRIPLTRQRRRNVVETQTIASILSFSCHLLAFSKELDARGNYRENRSVKRPGAGFQPDSLSIVQMATECIKPLVLLGLLVSRALF
jgi:hypothetical protein